MNVQERFAQFCAASLKLLFQAIHAANRLDAASAVLKPEVAPVSLDGLEQSRNVSLVFFCFQLQYRNAKKYAALLDASRQLRDVTETLQAPAADQDSILTLTKQLNDVKKMLQEITAAVASCTSIAVHFKALVQQETILIPACSYSCDAFRLVSTDRYELAAKVDDFYWTVRNLQTSEVCNIPWLFLLPEWQPTELNKLKNLCSRCTDKLRDVVETVCAQVREDSSDEIKAAAAQMMREYSCITQVNAGDAIACAGLLKRSAEFRHNRDRKSMKISWKCKMQVHSSTTVTETIQILPPAVDMDSLKEAEQTIERKMLIRAVLHPNTGEQVTLDVALREGIIDYEKGCYRNPLTGALQSIDQALSERKIMVEFVTVRTSQEKRHNFGIVKVKLDEVKNITQTYLVNSVLDRKANAHFSFDEAVERGLLLLDKSVYLDTMTSDTLSIPCALEKGFLVAERVDDPVAAFSENHIK